MQIYQLPEEQILLFALALLRVSAFVVTMPVIGTTAVPASLKILLSFTFTIIVFPISLKGVSNVGELLNDQIFLYSCKEVIVGVFLGFLTRFFFYSLNIAGEMVSTSSGINAAQMFDPTLSDNVSALENFHILLGTLLFFLFNGHHAFFQGLLMSFETLSITSVWFKTITLTSLQELSGNVILIGLKLSAPVWISILLANLGLALLGRAIPYLNVFAMSFHVTVMLAFGVLVISMPVIFDELGNVFQIMTTDFFKIVKGL